jgi:hypothetical protein
MKNFGVWSESVIRTETYCGACRRRNLSGVMQEQRVMTWYICKERMKSGHFSGETVMAYQTGSERCSM